MVRATTWGPEIGINTRRVIAVGTAGMLLLTGLLIRTAAPKARTMVVQPPLRERQIAAGAAWSWFGDPRAVYYQGRHRRTYVGWVARDGSIQVASYDHDSGQQVITTLKARLQVDDHDNPSILVRPDGRLMVFWSTHAGPKMWYRRSVRPEDITAWEPERTLPTNTPGPEGYTYPNPVQLSAERDRIYLFWRGGNFNPSFSTSINGDTWFPARTLISNPRQRPYVKYASNGRDTIAMAWTETHPRNMQTSVYYAAYRDGALRRADGSVISTMAHLPIKPTQGQKVYNWRTDGKAWVHDVALDAAGHPVIVYATFPSKSDHRYRYARWTGKRWIDRELVHAGPSMSVDPGEPAYSGGISLDHEDPSTVYLSRSVHGKFRLEVWTTRDGGATWSSRVVTSPSAGNDYRPVAPRGQLGDSMNVIWMHGTYPGFTDFHTGLRTQVRGPSVTEVVAPRPPGALGVGDQTVPVMASLVRAPGAPGGWRLKPVKVVGTTTVMADPRPRSAPIPVSEQAEAAD